MAELKPFPELVENRRLDPDRINGVDQTRLTIGADGDAVITFHDEVAAFQNALGVYLIDPDGTIRDPEIVFARIEHADPLPGFLSVRPGGGPLEPGDAVHLNALYPAADLQPGQEFGLFVVANGAARNPDFVFDGSGRLEFVNTTTHGPANVADDAAEIALRHIADDGSVRTVRGLVFHTADNDPDRLENDLNPDGAERVVSGLDPTTGALLLGFEDLIDFDFNDVVIGLGPTGAVPPPIVTPPGNIQNGFALAGIAYDISGASVASAGDVDGDGFGDMIIGGPGAPYPGNAGASYVVFGRAVGEAGASLDLASLDGINGFRLEGIDEGDSSGSSVASAGDVNGDGFVDLIIGTPNADPGGDYDAGESYVVFGRGSGFDPSLELAILDGTNGSRLDGIDEGDRSGGSVASAGDVNGDGFSDLVIGAPGAEPAGESYVVFGRASGFDASLELATLDGTNGFRLDGIDAEDGSGSSAASAGDINGDGFDDIIIGAPYAGSYGYYSGPGESYVVFGGASGFGASLDLAALDGTNGFRLDGIDEGDRSGGSVASAGDVNGDGLGDLIIGAPFAGAGGYYYAGESYVVFGTSSGFGASLDLTTLDGTNGFRLDASSPGRSGSSVAAAGDVNGDGFDDVIIGTGYSFESYTGSYLVFGRASGFGASLDLATLDGANGFRFDGGPRGRYGVEVASAGDVNGDGFADLIFGTPGGNDIDFSGVSWVISGGNFTGAVSQLGGVGDDTLAGTPGDDVILGAQGDDTLLGNGGIDVLNGGAGDDLLILLDSAFLEGFGTGGGRMLGGTGSDTLRLDGAGADLDLGAIPDPRIQNIENIDLGGDGNTLALDVLEILNLDDASNTLTVLGDDTNAVSGSLPGASEGTTMVGGVDFATFTVGQAQLLVQTGIDTTAIETAAV